MQSLQVDSSMIVIEYIRHYLVRPRRWLHIHPQVKYPHVMKGRRSRYQQTGELHFLTFSWRVARSQAAIS